MYTLREAADLLGVRPRQLRKWVDAGHFPGAVAPAESSGVWSIPHLAVTAFLRDSARRTQVEPSSLAPRTESTVTEVVAPTAISISAQTQVPWHVVQHLLLTEHAQRQAWQDLSMQHSQSMDVLRATLECERLEIGRLRDEIQDLRNALQDARTEIAKRNQTIPLQDWETATRTTQPISRMSLQAIVGGK